MKVVWGRVDEKAHLRRQKLRGKLGVTWTRLEVMERGESKGYERSDQLDLGHDYLGTEK